MGGVSSSIGKAYHGLGFVGAFVVMFAAVYAFLSHVASKATPPPPKKEEEVRLYLARPCRTVAETDPLDAPSFFHFLAWLPAARLGPLLSASNAAPSLRLPL